jgi:decaprenylphospho-beta-D-erythro-pentofuranosid-2-ulose 2-reductase
MKTVLILGANSDVAKEAMVLYVLRGYRVIAASRSVEEISAFAEMKRIRVSEGEELSAGVMIRYFDATDFASHTVFYASLITKPNIVVYAAGFQVTNEEALVSWEGTYRMMNVMYAGAVSILNIIAMDAANDHLERIIGLSSLSGVRGRKSNFIYGSTKAAFTTYLAGLRQYLASRGVVVNAVIAGYIRSKMTAGLDLPESLLMEPEFIAGEIVGAGNGFTVVPGFKWKIIYQILRVLPEGLVARLP